MDKNKVHIVDRSRGSPLSPSTESRAGLSGSQSVDRALRLLALRKSVV